MASSKSKKTDWVRVYPGVYERGIGSHEPYFFARIRRRGEKEVNKSFPYLPKDVVKITANATDSYKHTEKHKGRDFALQAAINFVTSEKGTYHFHGKTSTSAMSEQSLGDWLRAWVREACDRLDEDGKTFLSHMPERLGAQGDKQNFVYSQVGSLQKCVLNQHFLHIRICRPTSAYIQLMYSVCVSQVCKKSPSVWPNFSDLRLL